MTFGEFIRKKLTRCQIYGKYTPDYYNLKIPNRSKADPDYFRNQILKIKEIL